MPCVLLPRITTNPAISLCFHVQGLHRDGDSVHTCRLQYVEYFSKFYEGGGKVFTPLKINLQHFKFKEETINE